MTDTISLLLAIEARDRASAILDQIAGKVKGWEASMKAAADQSKLTSEQVEAANLKAEASAASYDRAVASQAAAQRELATAMDLSKAAQEQAAVAAKAGAAEQQIAAGEVKAAAEMEETALIRVQKAEELVKTRSEEMAAAQEAASTKSNLASDALKGAAVAAGAVAIGVGIVGEKSVRAAADFQTGMVKLTTTAGESTSKLGVVSAGVLQLAGDVGTTTENLSDGAYRVESAGFHGANALNVLRAAGEAARAESAQMDTVTRALTSALNAYGDELGKTAIPMTNEIIAAVGHGDMRMQDFASSLSAVLPIAAAAKISFAEVGGAVATMTAQGMTADNATQNLAHTIGKFQHATPAMTQYLWQLGIDAQDLAAHLGDRGLTGTIQIVSDAILKHMGPSGQVVVDIMNKSKSAADDARQMISKMPPELAKTAKAFLDGSITVADWRQAIKDLPANQEGMAKQFQSLVDQADGFNAAMKSGQPNVKEYAAALYAATGDQTAMNTVLKLSGDHMQVFKDNVDAVAAAGQHAGHDIAGWSDITNTFNFKMDALKGRLEAAKIAIGTGLLPAVTDITSKVIAFLTPITNWMTTHEHLTAIILGSIAALATLTLTIAAVAKTAAMLKLAWEAVSLAGGKLAPVANVVKLAVTEATTAMATAAPTAGTYGTAVAGIAGGAKGAATGLKGLVTSISPVGLALTALTIGVGYYINKAQEQKQRIDSLAQALNTLGQAYRQTHDMASEGVRDAILQNDKLTQLAANYRMYGVSIDTVTKASAGERDSQKQVIDALDQRRASLEHLAKQEQVEDGQHFKFWSARVSRTTAEAGSVKNLEDALKQQFAQMSQNDAATKALTGSGKQLSQSDQDLVAKLGELQRGNTDAATSSDTLKAAEDRLYGAAQNADQANEALAAAIDASTKAMQSNDNAIDMTTEAHRANRDTLIRRIQATNDSYFADIKSAQGSADVAKATDAATKKHDDAIAVLLDEAKKNGLNQDAVQNLIDTYGKIPNVKDTLIQITGYDDAMAKLNSLSLMTQAVDQGITVQQSHRLYSAGANADGGYITGPGGPRDDRILSLLSNGEYVIPANIVAKFGVGYFDQIRAGKLPSEGAVRVVPQFAAGGSVGPSPAMATVAVDHVGVRDRGGPVYPGANLIYNGTGRTEWINDPQGGGPGGGTHVTFDFRGSQIMSERDVDMLIQRIERRFVQELLPGAGVQLQR